MVKYSPVGRCIYCGKRATEGYRLTDEHIIPRLLGGKLILPNASCEDCARLTNKFETHCAKAMMTTARAHLGIQGKKIKRRSRMPAWIDGERKTLPVAEHPGTLVMFANRGPPKIISPNPDSDDGMVQFLSFGFGHDFMKRLSNQGKTLSLLGNGGRHFSSIEFARMLAKIAHAYLTAKKGYDSFKPLLLGFIRGENLDSVWDYIGGPAQEPPPRRGHQLGISKPVPFGQSQFLVVSIRLFGGLGFPPHWVVTGEYKA